LINRNTIFECESCENEFEIIPHSDFEESEVEFCAICGAPIEFDEDDDIEDLDYE
jgi:rRNA maturation endonuclease Nob1